MQGISFSAPGGVSVPVTVSLTGQTSPYTLIGAAAAADSLVFTGALTADMVVKFSRDGARTVLNLATGGHDVILRSVASSGTRVTVANGAAESLLIYGSNAYAAVLSAGAAYDDAHADFDPLSLGWDLALDYRTGAKNASAANAAIGDPVALWTNQGTDPNNATQADLSKMGVLTADGILLDAADDGYLVGTNLTIPYAIIIIEKPSAVNGGQRTLQSAASNRVISLSRSGLSAFIDGVISIYAAGPETAHFACLRVSGTSKFEVDGVDRTDNSAPVGDWGELSIGASGANFEPANTTLMSLFARNGLLSDDDVASMRAWAIAQRGVPS